MVKIKEFIKSRIDIVRSFFAANPQRAKFIGIIAIAIILPLTVGVALTIQNLSQRASQGVGVEIVDKDGIPISTTTDPNVFLKISLPSDWVIVPSSPQSNSLIRQAHAQSASPTVSVALVAPTLISPANDARNIPPQPVLKWTGTLPPGGWYEYSYRKHVSPDNITSGKTYDSMTTLLLDWVPGAQYDWWVKVCIEGPICSEKSEVWRLRAIEPSATPTTSPTALIAPTLISPANGATDIDPDSVLKWSGTLPSGGWYRYSYIEHGSTNIPSGGEISYNQGYIRMNKPNTQYDWWVETCIQGPICSEKSEVWTFTTAPASSITSTPDSTSPPTSYTVTFAPSINILKFVKIENKDADKSTNGSLTTTISVKNDSDIIHIPWRLNGLLPDKTQASRTIQVTLIGDSATASLMATIDLRKSTSTSTATLSRVELSLINCSSQLVIKQRCQMSAQAYDTAEQPIAKGVTYMWRISSTGKAASIGTLSQTNSNTSTLYAQNVGTGDVQVVAKVGSALVRKVITFSVTNITSPSPSSSSSTNNSSTSVPGPKPKTSSPLTFDLNRDGVINCKDSQIISLQFGKRGTNLSGDLNRDGIVNGTDYNTILRSYTLGDKTQCK